MLTIEERTLILAAFETCRLNNVGPSLTEKLANKLKMDSMSPGYKWRTSEQEAEYQEGRLKRQRDRESLLIFRRKQASA